MTRSYLEKENIGCVAAAISLGLVDKEVAVPLKGNGFIRN